MFQTLSISTISCSNHNCPKWTPSDWMWKCENPTNSNIFQCITIRRIQSIYVDEPKRNSWFRRNTNLHRLPSARMFSLAKINASTTFVILNSLSLNKKWVMFFKYCSSIEQYSEFLTIVKFFFQFLQITRTWREFLVWLVYNGLTKEIVF